MVWTVEIGASAKKELAGIDGSQAKRIVAFLRERVSNADDPRRLGTRLKGEQLGDLWRYRVGDYRVIAAIDDEVFRVLVVRVGHRRHVCE